MASQLQHTLRERGREQNQLHSSIRQYESRVSLLTAQVQRLEAENARCKSQNEVLQDKVAQAELSAAEERRAKEEAEGRAQTSARVSAEDVARARSEAQGQIDAARARANELEQQVQQLQALSADVDAKRVSAEREAAKQAEEAALLKEKVDKLEADKERAEAARVRKAAADAATQNQGSAMSRAEAVQAAMVRDQLIDDLRFKDEVIMGLRNDIDALRGVEEQHKATKLALETSQRALDSAIHERVIADDGAAAIAQERDELRTMVDNSKDVLRSMQQTLSELRHRAVKAEESLANLEAKAIHANEESRRQLLAREEAVADAAGAQKEAEDARQVAEENAKMVETLKNQNANFSQALSHATVTANELRAQVHAAQHRSAAAEREASDVRRQLEDREAALRRVEEQLLALSRAGAQETDGRLSAEEALYKANDEIQSWRSRCSTAESRASTLQAHLRDLKAEYENVADALGSERENSRQAEARVQGMQAELSSVQEQVQSLERQVKDKYEAMAALTVKTRHEVGERDKKIEQLSEERDRLADQLKGKLEAEQVLRDGIREATRRGTGSRRSPAPANRHASPNVHISRTGSVVIR